VQRPRFPNALPPVWNVPFRRNPVFTGREQALDALATAMGRGAAAAVTQAIQGSGGIGKTALAVEYAYWRRSEFDTVWWVRAEEPASLISDYTALAGALGLPVAGEADQHVGAAAVRRWLDSNDRWLVIFDNAQDPDTPTELQAPLARMVDLVPPVLHGQVLVTSRDANWDRYAALAELELFTLEEAVAFLLARSDSSDQASAAAVAELLGLLPLALEQAGAYVRATRIGLGDYLDRLRQFPALILSKGSPRDRDPADTVASTWQVSLERVAPLPGVVALLETCALLAPEEIPRALFAQQLDPPVVELGTLAADPFALDEAIAALRRFGLVKASQDTVTVHRLLQQVIRDQLDPDRAARRAGLAVRLLAAMFPRDGFNDPGVWPVCAQLLSHAVVAAGHAEKYQAELVATGDLLDSAAGYLHGRARYAEARALAERALALANATVGPDHSDTARSLDRLATVLRVQGDLDRARSLHERGLAIREAQLGPNHPTTARSLDNLALVLRVQGDLDRARSLHERGLAIREAQLGPNHPDTARSLHRLASTLRTQGELNTARTYLERALGIREAHLGADHPSTAYSLDRLATVLHDQGDLDTARTLLERALTIFEARMGLGHPTTARSLDHLALVLHDQGELNTAHTHLDRALTIREAVLGPDHPDTALSLSNLALVLADQGDLTGARALHERALAIREARLGPDHPDTARSRKQLAAVVAELGTQQ
jgi:tetratricopeptide (TPR) repeat protein